MEPSSYICCHSQAAICAWSADAVLCPELCDKQAIQLFQDDIEEDGETLITFHSLYNALLGMFQVMTSENWTDPCVCQSSPRPMSVLR